MNLSLFNSSLKQKPESRLLILASVFLLLSCHLAAKSQIPPSKQSCSQLLSDLAELESKAGVSTNPAIPVAVRLSMLEQKITGRSTSGGILARLAELKSIMNEKQKQTNALELSNPQATTINFAQDPFPLINSFPPNFLRIENTQSEQANAGDYFEEVRKASKGKSIHFITMPVAVYIQPTTNHNFINCVLRAFENWESKTNGAVRFVQVEDSHLARIRVSWKHLGSKFDGSGCLLGAHTILNYKDRGSGSLGLMSLGLVPLPIYIPRLGPKYQVPPQSMEVNLDLIEQKDPAIRYRCLQNIITHELGHALGLLGHSPCNTDIMYPVTDEHSRLSQRDINTLKRLYESKVDIPL